VNKILYLAIFTNVLVCLSVQLPETRRSPAHENLSGKWQLETSGSDSYPIENLTVVIAHDDPQIKFTRIVKTKLYSREQVLVYYTDGRGEENIDNGGVIKSSTKYDSRSVVIRASSMVRVAGDRIDIVRMDKWQLSKDGKSLKHTVEVRRTSSNATASIQPAYSQINQRFNRVQ
jgi:hypothetical protein